MNAKLQYWKVDKGHSYVDGLGVKWVFVKYRPRIKHVGKKAIPEAWIYQEDTPGSYAERSRQRREETRTNQLSPVEVAQNVLNYLKSVGIDGELKVSRSGTAYIEDIQYKGRLWGYVRFSDHHVLSMDPNRGTAQRGKYDFVSGYFTKEDVLKAARIVSYSVLAMYRQQVIR
jgi:hypothetical protein